MINILIFLFLIICVFLSSVVYYNFQKDRTKHFIILDSRGENYLSYSNDELLFSKYTCDRKELEKKALKLSFVKVGKNKVKIKTNKGWITEGMKLTKNKDELPIFNFYDDTILYQDETIHLKNGSLTGVKVFALD